MKTKWTLDNLATRKRKHIYKKAYREPPRHAIGKENLGKKLKNLYRVPLTWHPTKQGLTEPAPWWPLFFAGDRVCSQQSLCRVPDKKLPAKKSLSTDFLSAVLCRVLHPARLCRVQSSLCRVFLAPGKASESYSGSGHVWEHAVKPKQLQFSMLINFWRMNTVWNFLMLPMPIVLRCSFLPLCFSL